HHRGRVPEGRGMDVSRVAPAIMTERLDAEFYRPAFLTNQLRLSEFPCALRLADIIAEQRIRLGYTAPTEQCYGGAGPLYQSVNNVQAGCVVVEGDTDRISVAAHNGPMKKTQLHRGDILYTRTGEVGKAAILYDEAELYNFAAHI